MSETLPEEPTKQVTRIRLAVTDGNMTELMKLTKKKDTATVGKKFQTQLTTMQNSNWTPIIHKPSSDQLFSQRKELIANWFDLWSGSQRRQFLNVMLRHCTRRQLAYIYNWFTERVPPLQHLDFTTVLPRFLSLYIFSFLDPRSLCRASCVSWHWKFLSEQDELWAPKCSRQGWFLPFEPPEHELGAWKRHYIACVYSLDVELSSRTVATAEKLKDAVTRSKTSGMSSSLSNLHLARAYSIEKELFEVRPPWMPTDKTPRDIDRKSRKQMQVELNESAVKALARFDRRSAMSLGFGEQSTSSRSRKVNPFGVEMCSSPPRTEHRLLVGSNDGELTQSVQKAPLSCSLLLESHEGRRLKDLINMPAQPPSSFRHGANRPNLSGATGKYSLPWQKSACAVGHSGNADHPRLILISSRVPAAEVLHDAVLFEVIPVVYEYEGTTLDHLLHRIDLCLKGRTAKSIGIFVHGDVPWELRIVHDATVSIDNVDGAEFSHFFQMLSSHVQSVNDGGHIDVFFPLCSSEPGSQLVRYLSQQTQTVYITPTGHVGSYNRIYGDWSSSAEGVNVSIPLLYFTDVKLLAWSHLSEKAVDACRHVRSIIGRYFEKQQHDIVSQLVGELIFDSIGKTSAHYIRQVSKAVVDGLISISQQADSQSAVRLLGQYLTEISEQNQLSRNPLAVGSTGSPGGMGTLTPAKSLRPGVLSDHLKLDESFDGSINRSASGSVDDGVGASKMNADEDNYSDNDFESGSDTNTLARTANSTDMTGLMASQRSSNGDRKRPKDSVKFKENKQMPVGLTVMSRAHDIDRRTCIAQEILSSESDYCQTLDIIHDVFYAPFQSALESNRAIISLHNVQLIFNDVLLLRQLSQTMLSLLRPRLNAWDSYQCLGDVFVDFTGKLKTFINYFKSYPAVLSAIERCTEQVPVFRAFLRRRERTADTKMLTGFEYDGILYVSEKGEMVNICSQVLVESWRSIQFLPELLLAPVQHVESYVTLLAAFRHSTSVDHADIANLDAAIKSFTSLHRVVQQCKLRSEQERELLRIQKTIINCPALLESNRYFVKQIDACRLEPPSDDAVKPEMRVYQHVENIGLFLFSDALVVAQRTTHFIPYERYVEHIYTFNTCALLSRLEISDVPDSKYVQSAFRLHTPTRDWYCAVDNHSEKLDWITIVDKTIAAAAR